MSFCWKVVMLYVITYSIILIKRYFDSCYSVEHHSATFHSVEHHSAKRHSAECHSAKHHFGKCRGAKISSKSVLKWVLQWRKGLVVVNVVIDVGAEPDDPVDKLLVVGVRVEGRGDGAKATWQPAKEILKSNRKRYRKWYFIKIIVSNLLSETAMCPQTFIVNQW